MYCRVCCGAGINHIYSHTVSFLLLSSSFSSPPRAAPCLPEQLLPHLRQGHQAHLLRAPLCRAVPLRTLPGKSVGGGAGVPTLGSWRLWWYFRIPTGAFQFTVHAFPPVHLSLFTHSFDYSPYTLLPTWTTPTPTPTPTHTPALKR